MTTIKLDSNGVKHRITAVPVRSILSCTKTSDAAVYVGAVTQTGPVHNLGMGDSTLVDPSTLSMYLFTKTVGNVQYSAELELVAVPGAKPGDKALAVDQPVADEPASPAFNIAPKGRGARTGGTKD